MPNYSTITITHNEGSVEISRYIQPSTTNKFLEIEKLINYFEALSGGVRLATIKVGAIAVKATGTITFSAAGAANDTILVNGVTFTARASGATGNQWNVGASATASAAALAAAINASSTALVQNYVVASAASGVVTITAYDPGKTGNCITIAEGVDSTSAMTVSGARLTGGSNGTEASYSYGGSSL
jgi:phage tail sheath gpL-like